MPTLKPTRAAIIRAGQALRRGRLVAFPTETVYGLGADATCDRAVAAIYAAKRRPRRNPLIVHIADLRAARRLGVFNTAAERLARAFWPGPLTLVLPRRAGARLSRLIGTTRTVGIRMPADPVALSLVRAARKPLAAPSANASGAVSPTRAAHVRQSLGGGTLIIDGGATPAGVESTVVDLTGARPRLLRPGGIPIEELRTIIGPIDIAAPIGERDLLSPGRLASHYAPTLPVRLRAPGPKKGEAYLAFGKPPHGARHVTVLNLSRAGDMAEAAANLFAMLRALDRCEFSAIAVAPIPDRGLGRAINDRLSRAAAPRNQRSAR